MELMFRAFKSGIHMQVADDRYEKRILVIAAGHLWLRRFRMEVEFYREWESPILYFHIYLPFIKLCNDMIREVVTSATDLKYYEVPVITGKILWKSISKIQFPRRQDDRNTGRR